MNRLSTSIKTALLLSLFVTGCASHYHVGYNYLSEEKKALNNVHQKVDAELWDFELKTINAIHHYDINELKSLFAPKLAHILTESAIVDINAALKRRYQFGEAYERLRKGDSMPQGLPEFVDNFQIYDFIQAQFVLSGSPGAGAILFFTKVDGVPKLCGLYIVSLPEDTNPDKKVLGALAPETIDKSGFFSKRERRFGDFYQPVK